MTSSSSYFQPQTLDIDSGIFDRNLRIVDELNDKDSTSSSAASFQRSSSTQNKITELSQKILSSAEDYPSVQVTPTPGLCIKTKNVKNEKVFINLCKIQEIPPPPPLSEQELCDIISKDDYSNPYKVPMSISAPRKEEDKTGNPCWAADVAINSVWFDSEMENSIVFTTFVINLAMEGLCDKYGDDVNLDRNGWNILKNKKYLGKVQRHHIQQRSNKIKEVQEADKIQLPSNLNKKLNKKEFLIEEHKSKPIFKIIKDPIEGTPEHLVVVVQLPGIKSNQDIALDVGEDRLCLETSIHFLDIFVPFQIISKDVVAQFHRDKRDLSITLPLKH